MRRDGWSSRLKIHRTLGVLVSAQIQSTPYCSGRTLRPITTFSTDNTNDGPKPNLSTVDAIPGHPPNLTDMMQLYQFSDKPTANKTEREPTEVPPTPVESSSAETSETSPTVEAPVAADSTDSPEEVETMVTEKKVRAKRVRLPDEPPRFHPKPPDDWLNPDAFRDDVGTDVSLSTLLFHQSTPNTAVSHVRSVDKVVDDMPLYTVDAKKWIFLKTGWLQAVDEYERRHASYKIESEGDAGGEDSSMKNDTNEGSTSEKLPDGDATPTPEESGVDSIAPDGASDEALNATPEVVKPAKNAPPSTHMDVIGRAKVMRYLLYKFFKHQELWFDQMQELIALATKEVLEESGVTGTKEVVWPLPPQFTRSRVQHVNVFSSSVLERFSHILTMGKEKLQEDDPKILWDCFLLQHALDPTLLPSPNRAPFSFGELQPSISESDVELLRYDFPPDDRLEVKSAKERTKTPADFTEKEWESLNDWQKNCILFNSLSANVASAAVRGNSGIYVVHNYDAERPAADRETKGDDLTGKEPPTEGEVFLEGKRRLELFKASRYSVDRFHLGLIEPALYSVSAGNVVVLPTKWKKAQRLFADDLRKESQTKRKKKKGHTLKHKYYTGGFFLNAYSGELEDAQLSHLWDAFRKRETSLLVDDLLHLSLSFDHLKRQLSLEAIHQIAFLILFFSLNEVRAITAPVNTFYRLQHYHRQLKSFLYGALCADGVVEWKEEVYQRYRGHTEDKNFTDLSPSAQVSFACFGSSYLRPWKSEEVSEADLQRKAEPDAPRLYQSLLSSYSSTPLHKSSKSAFPVLLESQKLAVGFCFPQDAMEEEELSLLHRSPEERTLPLVSVPAPNAMLTDSATDAENVKLTKMMKLLSRKYTVKAPKKPSGLKRGRKPKKETTTTESTPSNEEAVNSIIQDLLVKKSSATKKHQKKKPTVTREKNQSKSPENVINPLQKRKRGRPPKVKPDLSTTTKTPSRKGKVPDDEEMYFAFMQFLQKYNPAKRKKQLQAKKKDVRPKKEKSTLSKKKKSATQKKTKPSNPKKKSRPHYMFF